MDARLVRPADPTRFGHGAGLSTEARMNSSERRWIGMSAAFATSNLARTAISFATSLVIARSARRRRFRTLDALHGVGGGADHGGRFRFRRAADARCGARRSVDWPRRRGCVRRAARRAGAGGASLRARALVPFGRCRHCRGAAHRALHCHRRCGVRVPGAGVPGVAARAGHGARPSRPPGRVAQWAGAWWLVQAGTGIVDLLVLAAAVQAMQFAAAVGLWLRIAGTPFAGRVAVAGPRWLERCAMRGRSRRPV